MEHDDWTAADEAAWDRADELRAEYAEGLHEERRARRADRCQCLGIDMPGRCHGPANCPLAQHDDADTETEETA